MVLDYVQFILSRISFGVTPTTTNSPSIQACPFGSAVDLVLHCFCTLCIRNGAHQVGVEPGF